MKEPQVSHICHAMESRMLGLPPGLEKNASEPRATSGAQGAVYAACTQSPLRCIWQG
jgi:hypothetical protein